MNSFLEQTGSRGPGHTGRLTVNLLWLPGSLIWCSAALGQWTHLGPATSYERSDHGLTLQCGPAAVRIEATSPSVVRIRLAPDGRFGRDFSWAVLDTRPAGAFVSFEDQGDHLRASTGELEVVVQRSPCRIEVRDAAGHALVVDELARGMGWRQVEPAAEHSLTAGPAPREVRVWQALADGVSVFGLGEKAGPMELRGRALSLWNTDAPAYGPTTDPLYKAVPFFIIAREGRYHGVFFDNPWRTSFDFGLREPEVLSFGAEGGELNYYVIAGPEPKDVVRRYTELTGRMELPPKWALGYQQCRFSYYPDSRVREIARTFRQKRIPCDVLYFDIDYMDGYRSFTWSGKWFPDPAGLMKELHELGFHAVAIIDPGIKLDPGYAVYDQGTQLGAWLTRPDGETYVGRVWPGESVFPDFTRPQVRAWWSGLVPPFVDFCGVDGIWNDMNEPADFSGPHKTVPLDVRHDNAGEPASHRACHNVYGMQMARASFEGLKQARPGRRVFNLTRATYAGGQRYGAAWTGDNVSTWEHLRMSIPMTLGLGVCGFPFVGPDIGGFVGGATPQLYARWIQVGSLFPFCRTHTAWDNPDQEPWSFGPEVEAIARRALERRYAMLPYLYTLFEEASRTGVPVLRPLWMEFPGLRAWYENQVFMLGADIYVVPVVFPDAPSFWHRLPPGVWFDVRTGLIHGGGQRVKIRTDADALPMFARGGAIVPMQSPVQSTMEDPEESLILDVWPYGESEGSLYEDDGESLAYQSGEYSRTRFRCSMDGSRLEFTLEPREGSYELRPRTPLVRFRGLPAAIQRVTCTQTAPAGEGEPAVWEMVKEPGAFCHDAEADAWLVRMLPDTGRGQILRVDLAPADGIKDTGVRFEFSDAETSIAYSSDSLPPVVEDGAVQLRVQSAWNTYVVLTRLRLSAEALPVLQIRLSTQHASKLGVRFATEQDPTLSDRSEMLFDVIADGALHEYVFDLAEASGGAWTGTVYWVRLDFKDGVRAGERIVIDELAIQRWCMLRSRRPSECRAQSPGNRLRNESRGPKARGLSVPHPS